MNAHEYFVVTAEDFESYEKRLADCGIKVRPMARETVDDLEKGGVSHVMISGILTFGGAEYLYHITKYPNACHLTVDAFSHGKDRGKALLTDLRHIFPQPERQPEYVAPVQGYGWDAFKKRTTRDTIGCFVVLAFIGALLFFAAVGIGTLFGK